MAAAYSPSAITPTAFIEVLSRYYRLTSSPSSVSSKGSSTAQSQSLHELDLWRLNTLPSILQERDSKEGKTKSPYITHRELEDIMKCKMKRGKFRPTLLPLISSNDPSKVKTVSSEAFARLKDTSTDKPASIDVLKQAINHLTKNLKGVGPATASYILAAKEPCWTPAFSDEAFRWAFLDSDSAAVKGSRNDGWKRKMDYSLKEYTAFVQKVWAIGERLVEQSEKDDRIGNNEKSLFNANSVEMVGWVLGKEEAGWVMGPDIGSGSLGLAVAVKAGEKGGKRKRQHEVERESAEEAHTVQTPEPLQPVNRKPKKEEFNEVTFNPVTKRTRGLKTGTEIPDRPLRRSGRNHGQIK